MGVVELLKEIEVKAQEGQMGIAGELQAKYDEGFAEGEIVGFKKGQDSIVLPDPSNPDKIYTQSDMDSLAAIVRSEKDAEYGPQLVAKDEAFAVQGAELAAVKAELEALKVDIDGRVVAGALARVDMVKSVAKEELAAFAKADDDLAAGSSAKIDAL